MEPRGLKLGGHVLQAMMNRVHSKGAIELHVGWWGIALRMRLYVDPHKINIDEWERDRFMKGGVSFSSEGWMDSQVSYIHVVENTIMQVRTKMQ